MKTWALRRVDTLEWLDLGRGSAWDVRQNLAEMDRINHWLGGTAAITRHLYPRLRACTQRVLVADLGTGSAGVPASIQAWGKRHGLDVHAIGIDWSQRNLSAARHLLKTRSLPPLVCADASRPPFALGGFDFVISSMFLHHFDPPSAVQVLRQAYELCSAGLIMGDLVRGRLPWLAFRLAQPVFARHPFTRHDGVLSIRRAYTPTELRELAAWAGIPNARVYTHPFWRMTLVADK